MLVLAPLRRLRPARPTRAAGALLLAAGCTVSSPVPDLGELYTRVAQEHQADRNPVILIPGILGSNLRQQGTGRVVWGAFAGDYANPTRPDGARLVALPMRRGAPLAELTDDVAEAGALESLEVRPFGLRIDVSAYVQILLALGVGGYRDSELGRSGAVDYGADHFTCFQFSYDWRRDLSETAARFEAFLDESEAYLRAEYAKRGIEKDEIRFDVVAHSMGGLVLRYYLRHGGAPLGDEGELPELSWAGARRIERAVLVATPSAGSSQSFVELCEGTDLGPFLPRYGPAVVGTMPSVYQLLPRPDHGWLVDDHGALVPDPLDPAFWQAHQLGLCDPDVDRELAWLLPDAADAAERRAIAADHQAKCLRRARRFFAAMDRPAAPPPGTELFLVAGDSIRTTRGLALRADRYRRVEVADRGPGDGTVLRASALWDERQGGAWTPVLRSPIAWSRVLFLFRDHLGLTQDPAFIDNLLFLLLEEPRPGAATATLGAGAQAPPGAGSP